MKKLLLVCFCCIAATAVAQQKKLAIIPEPVLLQQKAGSYTLPQKLVLVTANGTEARNVAVYLQKKLQTATGRTISVTHKKQAAAISFSLLTKNDASIGKEGYHLSVKPTGIQITANAAAGLFYGVQSLLQLFPPAIESNRAVQQKWVIPCVEITDYPRFGWRGLMLDVSRHFFTKDEVKQFIDEMARYKFNLFHWHLVDDEGWRVEIKSLPRLTEVGAWNVKRVGHFGNFNPIRDDEPRTYGGYYTQEDIKEVVQYATERFVHVLPEIDMPGHSLAAVVAYPELSCTAEANTYKVRSGEEIVDWSGPGFKALIDNTICPANENVYPFIDKLMTELAALFPFEYIHVGGDECAKNFWEKSDAIKALMQKENLKTMEQVQGYFENRVEKIVNSKGKKMIGWDEILEGGVSPTAAIMSWRGTKGGIEASNKGHEVVMCPTDYAYLDYMQSDAIMEPKVYASLRLNKTYSYEPISEGINEKKVKGLQGNLWTEQVYNFRQVQYMIWPRAFAISETAWSPAHQKDWTNFVQKVETHFKRFDRAEIKYAPSMYDPVFNVRKNEKGELVVSLATEIEGLDIYYSFDNSYPDCFYPKYSGPVIVPEDAALMRVITYRGKTPAGRINNMPVAELKKRAEKK
ncbi:MAG TPA: family 20 glycosylhydrolase [Ferruginibacter sp.]|nr:family 20 glycosylhydrolase [Ferruginibacter sp.]HMP20766.1 family 20 glycosylhydrolase [Ferruginibacter sp.]